MRNVNRRLTKIGGGGYHCPCCGPSTGKNVDKMRRRVKKRERRLFSNLIEQELRDSGML